LPVKIFICLLTVVLLPNYKDGINMKCGKKKSHGALDGKLVQPVMLPFKYSIKIRCKAKVTSPLFNHLSILNFLI